MAVIQDFFKFPFFSVNKRVHFFKVFYVTGLGADDE